jgi:hypothetical protein
MKLTHATLAAEVQRLFALDPNHPLALLGDAALSYNSTASHNAICVRAALDAILQEASHTHWEDVEYGGGVIAHRRAKL